MTISTIRTVPLDPVRSNKDSNISNNKQGSGSCCCISRTDEPPITTEKVSIVAKDCQFQALTVKPTNATPSSAPVLKTRTISKSIVISKDTYRDAIDTSQRTGDECPEVMDFRAGSPVREPSYSFARRYSDSVVRDNMPIADANQV